MRKSGTKDVGARVKSNKKGTSDVVASINAKKEKKQRKTKPRKNPKR